MGTHPNEGKTHPLRSTQGALTFAVTCGFPTKKSLDRGLQHPRRKQRSCTQDWMCLAQSESLVTNGTNGSGASGEKGYAPVEMKENTRTAGTQVVSGP